MNALEILNKIYPMNVGELKEFIIKFEIPESKLDGMLDVVKDDGIDENKIIEMVNFTWLATLADGLSRFKYYDLPIGFVCDMKNYVLEEVMTKADLERIYKIDHREGELALLTAVFLSSNIKGFKEDFNIK